MRPSLQKVRIQKVGMLLFAFINFLIYTTPSSAAPPSCSDSQSTSYKIHLCITQPEEGAIITGVQQVEPTITVTGVHPGIRRVVYYLNDEYLLTAYSAPYRFELPSSHYVDGSYRLSADVLMRDDFTTSRTTTQLQFQNGVTTPPVNNNTFTPFRPASASGEPLIVAAVGDGASGERPEVTNLIASWRPQMFLYLSDVYERGAPVEFYNWYGAGNRFFGQFKAITNPTIGNHEYNHDGKASGYFDYWDNIPHFYSYDAGGWHFISLDTTGYFQQTGVNSLQYQWLIQDLANNRADCTLAYFESPRYSVGAQGDQEHVQELWTLLANNGVDIVLSGNDHSYQRWQSLDANGNPASQGITQFVVGTGGHGMRRFVRSDARLKAGVDTVQSFGALRLELYPDRAQFQYINVLDASLDSGAIQCSKAPEQQPIALLLSSTRGGSVGGGIFVNEDIIAYNLATHEWSKFFDGSDMGLALTNLNAFAIQADGSILMSFSPAIDLPGLGLVERSDIVRFVPTSLGTTTAGAFYWFLDGSDVGLEGASEEIDAIAITPDGQLAISTRRAFSVPNLNGGDEDLILLNNAIYGSNTSGVWTLYFDGSDVNLNAEVEDVKGAWIDPATNEIYLTTLGTFSVRGVSGAQADIFVCTFSTIGEETDCAFRLFWQGAPHGFGAEFIDGVYIDRGAQLLANITTNPADEEVSDAHEARTDEASEILSYSYLPFITVTQP